MAAAQQLAEPEDEDAEFAQEQRAIREASERRRLARMEAMQRAAAAADDLDAELEAERRHSACPHAERFSGMCTLCCAEVGPADEFVRSTPESELESELELEPEPEPEPERQPCWECSGEGVIGSGKRRKACGSCSGSGWEQVSRSAGAPKPSRRKPAKQRPAATEEPASGEPASGEAAALTKMSVRDLRQRGRQLGVPEPELTVAIEGDNPKKALIALIEALGPPSAAAEPEPEPELLDVSVEVGTQSAQPSVEERLGVARAKNAAGEKLSMKEKKLIKQHGKEPSHSDRAGAADEQLKPS